MGNKIVGYGSLRNPCTQEKTLINDTTHSTDLWLTKNNTDTLTVDSHTEIHYRVDLLLHRSCHQDSHRLHQDLHRLQDLVHSLHHCSHPYLLQVDSAASLTKDIKDTIFS